MDQHKITSLTATSIQTAARQTLGNETDLSQCHRILEGGEHDVWSVGNSTILRALPATGRTDGWAESSVERDAAVCTLLRKHLSNPNLIPEVYKTVVVDGWICNLESYISGTSLEAVAPNERTEDNLAEVLRTLASVPIEEAKEAVGNYQEDKYNLRMRVFKALRAWNELRQAGYVSTTQTEMHDLLLQKLTVLKELDKDSVYQPVLLHGDIKGEHILIDPTTGELKGIIDWSDASLGDPCEDIAGVSLAVGRDIARRVASKAQYPQVTVERGLLYAMCLAIVNLRDRICGDDDSPEDLLRTQFRRAFEGTSLMQLDGHAEGSLHVM